MPLRRAQLADASPPSSLGLADGRELVFGERTYVMGIVNATPDSFSDGGEHFGAEAAIAHGVRLIAEGADLVDVGGESTRPGATPVSLAEELDRVLPVVDALCGGEALVSVDTYKARVAEAALAAGAHLINDISGLQFDPGLAGVIADAGAPLVLMHTPDRPSTMQRQIRYDDVVDDILAYFEARMRVATEAGIDDARILLDPGIGFGKSVDHNFEILGRLHELRRLGRPLLLGTSRKSFIGAVTGKSASERLFGTAATVGWCAAAGADIVRVHDVAQGVDVVRVTDAIARGRRADEPVRQLPAAD